MIKKYVVLFCFSCCLINQLLHAQSSFVKVKDHQFTINNKPYYYIGANYWYGGLLAMVKDREAGKKRLLNELDFLHLKGVNNLRVLAGVEGFGKLNGVKRVSPSLQTSQGVFDTALLKGLDFLLVEMGKRNMKAVIYLSNNWDWSGGFLQYLNWNGKLPDSILQRKLSWDENRDIVSSFYSCEPCKQAYFKQVKLIVNRTNSITGQPYKNDAAIMAWQLANEPRPMRLQAIPAYIKWVSAAAALIKSLDKNHLVTTGSEGEQGSENMATYNAIHAGKNVDYLTIHIWPKNWGWFGDTSISKSLNSIIINTKKYIDKHTAVASTLQKPLVIEEFGLPRDGHQFNPQSTTLLRDSYYSVLFNILEESRIKNGYIAGCNFWGFGGYGRSANGSNYWWSDGDDYMADPPPEEQGLNNVFDQDTSTWNVIQSFTNRIHQ